MNKRDLNFYAEYLGFRIFEPIHPLIVATSFIHVGQAPCTCIQLEPQHQGVSFSTRHRQHAMRHVGREEDCSTRFMWRIDLIRICSMYGIFTYIWLKFMVDVGEYSIHGAPGSKINPQSRNIPFVLGRRKSMLWEIMHFRHLWTELIQLISNHGNPQPSFLGVISYNPYL